MPLHALSRKFGLTVLAAASAAIVLANVASAQGNAPFGPLEIVEGNEDPWQLTLTPQGYLMENNVRDTSIRYTWYRAQERIFGSRTVTTWVTIVDEDPTSAAGLIYGHEEEDNGDTYYYMFMVRPDNVVTLYLRHPDGVDQVSSIQTTAVRPGENELSIMETGDQVRFFVNGEQVVQIGGVRGMGEGAIGIIAWGIGTYLFSGYVEESPQYDGGVAPPAVNAVTLPPAKG